jgi:hypothetical protein
MTPTPSVVLDVQKDIVVDILHKLEVTSRSSISKQDIMRLGVIVKTFDPNDQDLSASECLFKPISKGDIKRWKISAAEAAMVSSHLDIPDLASQNRHELNITVATQQVFHFIMTQFSYRRQKKTSLRDTFGWNEIE